MKNTQICPTSKTRDSLDAHNQITGFTRNHYVEAVSGLRSPVTGVPRPRFQRVTPCFRGCELENMKPTLTTSNPDVGAGHARPAVGI